MVQQDAEHTRIGVKEAVKIGRDTLTKLYDGDLPHLMLEEVEISDDGEYWYITFGFDTERQREPAEKARNMLDTSEYVRAYKVVTVRASDGNVMSMKIREA